MEVARRRWLLLVAVVARGSTQGKGVEFLRSLLQTEGVLAPQSICQSSGHSGGGTIFGPILARHVLVSASSVRGSPPACYTRNKAKSWWRPYKLVAKQFCVTRVTRQSLVAAKLVTWVGVRRNSMIFCRPPLLSGVYSPRDRRQKGPLRGQA